MKGQVGKVETLQDNSIKLSISIQPENVPDDVNVIKWQYKDVNVAILSEDMVTISKAEYEALTQGHNIAVPYKFIEGLKTIRTVIDDAIAEAEQRG